MRGEKNRITEFRPQANGELFPDNSEEKIEKMSGRSQHEEPAVSASVFVTVGTTSFDDLIHTLIYDDDVLQTLKKHGFKKMILQIGNGAVIPDCDNSTCIEMEYFRFKPSISDDIAKASVVISHAGSGSILETLIAKKPMIVVVNESLMDNHQLELAEAFYKMNNLLYCSCSSLKSVVKEMRIDSLTPYTEGRPDIFGAYINEFMGFGDL